MLLLGEALVKLHRQRILLRPRRAQFHRKPTERGPEGRGPERAEDIAPGNLPAGEERQVSGIPAWRHVHGESGIALRVSFSPAFWQALSEAVARAARVESPARNQPLRLRRERLLNRFPGRNNSSSLDGREVKPNCSS